MPKGREWKIRRKIIVPIVLLTALMLTIQITLPGSSAPAEGGDEILGYVGDDFIISFDDSYTALHPAIAMTPTNEITTKYGTHGSTHVVWDEVNELTGIREIHYSMSVDGGLTWTGEKDDIIISNQSQEKASSGDAVDPSITVDSNGRLHVVWAEQYLDETWEVHYSRSDNNGKKWTSIEIGDKCISFLDSGFPANIISAPKIVAGVIPGQVGSDILHVAWSEYDAKREQQEIFYSRSDDFGDTWSGVKENNMISLPSEAGTGYASNPVITISGLSAEFVHVSWVQKGKTNGSDEIYYLKSSDEGKNWIPEDEKSITPDLSDGINACNLSMTSYKEDVHLTWSQSSEKITKACGILYSGSRNNGKNWTSQSQKEEIPINNNEDGNAPINPSIAVTDSGVAYVFWSEFHKETIEVHTSYSPKPMDDPTSWSGQKGDQIISTPDSDGFIADVANVSVALDALPDGSWRPQVVWDEPNNEAKANSKTGEKLLASGQNNEIHYDPVTWTLTVSTDGSGTVSKNPDKTSYPDGESVELTATPSAGWSFDQWSGSLTGSINPDTIIMNSDKAVTATFTQDQYTLNISTNGNGTVSKNPDQATYTYGTTVELTANPDPGWSFDHWTGSLSGSINPTTITINANKVVNAYFTENVYYVNLTTNWNLVSLPFIQDDTAIASVLSSINGSYDSVKYYNNLDGRWKSYRPGSITNDLSDIDHTMAFWVHTTSACTLTVHGNISTSTGITLYAGWNFVGYPTQDETYNVTEALSGTNADRVEGFQLTSPYIKVLSGSDLMIPGRGYWVHVPATTVWTINW